MNSYTISFLDVGGGGGVWLFFLAFLDDPARKKNRGGEKWWWWWWCATLYYYNGSCCSNSSNSITHIHPDKWHLVSPREFLPLCGVQAFVHGSWRQCVLVSGGEVHCCCVCYISGDLHLPLRLQSELAFLKEGRCPATNGKRLWAQTKAWLKHSLRACPGILPWYTICKVTNFLVAKNGYLMCRVVDPVHRAKWPRRRYGGVWRKAAAVLVGSTTLQQPGPRDFPNW